MKRLDRNQIIAIYNQGPDAVVAVIEMLQDQIDALEKRIERLEQMIHKDSHNSSKPPSSDIPKRLPQSLREKSGRKKGGQLGHPGWTLSPVRKPDHVVRHSLRGQCTCGRMLNGVAQENVIRRQVFDIVLPQLEVTEHQAATGVCGCGKKHTAAFPEGITGPVQYGHTLEGLILYLNSYHLLPLQRIQEFMGDVFKVPLSQGTVRNIAQRAYLSLEETEEFIRRSIRASPVIHVDETRLSVGGKTQWLHSCGAENFTLYWSHEKRNTEAMKEAGVLTNYKGRAVHDYWYPYFQFGCSHALCNAHHLRELTFFEEELQQKWAGKMIRLLCTIKATVGRARRRNRDRIHPATRAAYWERYNTLLKEGYKTNPTPGIRRFPGKSGRRKQHPARNLLDRFTKHAHEVLAFMDDFSVPFDNNAAERDIRMVKVQQKISGCFRSPFGAKSFCRIRSYIASVKKHGFNILDYLIKLFNSNGNKLLLIPE